MTPEQIKRLIKLDGNQALFVAEESLCDDAVLADAMSALRKRANPPDVECRDMSGPSDGISEEMMNDADVFRMLMEPENSSFGLPLYYVRRDLEHETNQAFVACHYVSKLDRQSHASEVLIDLREIGEHTDVRATNRRDFWDDVFLMLRELGLVGHLDVFREHAEEWLNRHAFETRSRNYIPGNRELII